MSLNEQKRRAFRATLITAGIIVLAPISAQALEWAGSTGSFVQSMGAVAAASMGGDGAEASDMVSEYAKAFGVGSGGKASEEFCQECLDLSARDDLLVSSSGALMGFTETGECGEVYSGLASQLRGNGWTEVESGYESQATFVKYEGAFRWLYMACVESGSCTSVVIQVVNDGRS